MKQRLIYLLSIIFTIIVIVLWILLLNRTVFAKSEPIQEILNQIQMNESELQQIETRADELNKANEEAKSRLLNEYWLELSKAFTKNVEQKEESQWLLLEDENWNCIWWIGCEPEERTPWKLNESWDAQEMPIVEWNDSHEKFKNLAIAYWLDASQIRAVENHYWITEWVILCITVAETSWWNRWAWWKNIWSVWSNDRWDRPTYALMESWLEDIWKTLTNRYLWKKQTLWCLSNAWSCKETNDNWKRYATSESHREKNMTACLSTIYWSIDPETFSIRR